MSADEVVGKRRIPGVRNGYPAMKPGPREYRYINRGQS